MQVVIYSRKESFWQYKRELLHNLGVKINAETHTRETAATLVCSSIQDMLQAGTAR